MTTAITELSLQVELDLTTAIAELTLQVELEENITQQENGEWEWRLSYDSILRQLQGQGRHVNKKTAKKIAAFNILTKLKGSL